MAASRAGDSPNRLKRKAPDSSDAITTSSTSAGEDQVAVEEEVEELEREVSDLGRRILEHRRNAATRLLDAAVQHIAALRPAACPEVPAADCALGTSHAEAEQDEKLKVFKSNSEDIIAAVPKLLGKMKECEARAEKLEKLNLTVHTVFQRKR